MICYISRYDLTYSCLKVLGNEISEFHFGRSRTHKLGPDRFLLYRFFSAFAIYRSRFDLFVPVEIDCGFVFSNLYSSSSLLPFFLFSCSSFSSQIWFVASSPSTCAGEVVVFASLDLRTATTFVFLCFALDLVLFPDLV